MSEITIKLRADGGIDIDASKVQGGEKEILSLLEDLAEEVGGDLEVERHVGGAHHHHHTHGREHN